MGCTRFVCSKTRFSGALKIPTGSNARRPAPDTHPGIFKSNSATSGCEETLPIRLVREVQFSRRRNVLFNLILEVFLALRGVVITFLSPPGHTFQTAKCNGELSFEVARVREFQACFALGS